MKKIVGVALSGLVLIGCFEDEGVNCPKPSRAMTFSVEATPRSNETCFAVQSPMQIEEDWLDGTKAFSHGCTTSNEVDEYTCTTTFTFNCPGVKWVKTVTWSDDWQSGVGTIYYNGTTYDGERCDVVFDITSSATSPN